LTQTTPKSECPQKIALLASVQHAMGELMAIHNSEVVALLAEDFVLLDELRSKLRTARERKADMIDRYRAHVESHGC
jgi:hypothetical protein